MEHPAFSDAGAAAGVEIWTIDKFEPVPIDEKMYGKFYNGDSYIVLKTTGDQTLTYNAHFWLGSKTSQDKQGSAAILTVTLDDMLGGRAVQHREVQGHESSQFLGYFKPAIRYLEGGNESGFNEVETNAGAEKRLLKLSGCDNMRIEGVPADSSSLTRDHCFILEVDHDIFVLLPEGAKASQRRKIISVANKLRDDDHNGRATIEIIDEFSSDEDVNRFFEALGSGSRDDMLDDDSSDSYSRDSTSAVYLYRVLYSEGVVELVSLSKPFKQKHLAFDEIYILDTPCSGVYIWLGKDVDSEVKKNYFNIAQEYLNMKGYPTWVHVTRVSEGSESSNFQQYFHSWDTVSAAYVTESDAGYFSSDADESAASAKIIGKRAAVSQYMPGEGSLNVTRIHQGEPEDLSEQYQSGLSVLYSSDVYVLKYQYTDSKDEEAYVLYLWVGATASASDRALGVSLASELEADSDNSIIVYLNQGREPKHFLSLFKGDLAILFGDKDTEYAAKNSKNTYDEDNVRLFRVEGTETGVDTRVTQVPEDGDQLEDDDVYVLETQAAYYVWHGKESSSIEQETAEKFVTSVLGDQKPIEVIQQGEEPQEFWDALGSEPRKIEDNSGWKQAASKRLTTPPTLTSVGVSVKGKISFEELPPDFTQQDLSDDGVYILDAGEEIYMWTGANVPERMKNVRINILVEYMKDDGLERTPDSHLVVVLKQGREPAVFKNMFKQGWDDEFDYNQES